MGANARRRHGAIDMTPKIVTPFAERAIPMVYNDALSGPSNRARKKLKGYIDITSTPAVEEKPLDPKPFRIGRKRYTITEATNYTENEGLVFSPRSGYELNIPRYAALYDE
jgi:hypothetical protein